MNSRINVGRLGAVERLLKSSIRLRPREGLDLNDREAASEDIE